MTLRALCFISGIYDSLIGIAMLFAPLPMAHLFGAPEPTPLISAQLNGVFTLTLGLGYFWAAGDTTSRRGYLWVAGVFAKTLGASVFVWSHFAQGTPASFLLFAVTDGILGLGTFALLQRQQS